MTKARKLRAVGVLYNARPTWLDIVHRDLGAAVFAAYGWDASMPSDAIVEALLVLNLERESAGAAKAQDQQTEDTE